MLLLYLFRNKFLMVLSLSIEIYNISVLDLKPHWVTYHSHFHGGCGVQIFQERDRVFDESARCSPAWWQRCFAASACEQGSRLGIYRVSSFISSFGFFSLRDFAAHSDGVSPADVGVVFYSCYSGLLLFLYYYYYFIYSEIYLILFI
jgi:hypothetical protein